MRVVERAKKRVELPIVAVRNLEAGQHWQVVIDGLAPGDRIKAWNAQTRALLADVRAFGLTWDDCEHLLKQLGYAAQVHIVAK